MAKVIETELLSNRCDCGAQVVVNKWYLVKEGEVGPSYPITRMLSGFCKTEGCGNVFIRLRPEEVHL